MTKKCRRKLSFVICNRHKSKYYIESQGWKTYKSYPNWYLISQVLDFAILAS